jgi:hypothetical protein
VEDEAYRGASELLGVLNRLADGVPLRKALRESHHDGTTDFIDMIFE